MLLPYNQPPPPLSPASLFPFLLLHPATYPPSSPYHPTCFLPLSSSSFSHSLALRYLRRILVQSALIRLSTEDEPSTLCPLGYSPIGERNWTFRKETLFSFVASSSIRPREERPASPNSNGVGKGDPEDLELLLHFGDSPSDSQFPRASDFLNDRTYTMVHGSSAVNAIFSQVLIICASRRLYERRLSENDSVVLFLLEKFWKLAKLFREFPLGISQNIVLCWSTNKISTLAHSAIQETALYGPRVLYEPFNAGLL